jgi:ribosomal protein S18 acetylase RimI-like enzyme
VDPDVEETFAAIRRSGSASLVIDDLLVSDLPDIAWSGHPGHIDSVAQYLSLVPTGEIEYLAVRSVRGRPVAMAAIRYTEAPDVGVIMQMATHPDLQSLGLGTALVAAGERRIGARGLRRARLEVEDDNPRARALYERLGYAAVARREVSWESQRPDGSVFLYETVVTQLEKEIGP